MDNKYLHEEIVGPALYNLLSFFIFYSKTTKLNANY